MGRAVLAAATHRVVIVVVDKPPQIHWAATERSCAGHRPASSVPVLPIGVTPSLKSSQKAETGLSHLIYYQQRSLYCLHDLRAQAHARKVHRQRIPSAFDACSELYREGLECLDGLTRNGPWHWLPLLGFSGLLCFCCEILGNALLLR